MKNKLNQKSKANKRVVSVAPVVEKAAPACEHVGDEKAGVAYPAFLMQWDERREGKAAVRARIRPREGENEAPARARRR